MRRLLLQPFIASLAPLVTLVLGACSAAPPGDLPEERTGQSSSEIINGKASDTTQDAVVLLFYPVGGNAFECSGALLAPNLVLTARHCVSDTADAPFTCDKNGVGSSGADTKANFTASNMFVVTGSKRPSDPTSKGSFAAIGKQIIHDGARNLCDHDIALIVLDRAIPNAKIVPVRVDAPAKKGETFTAVGWGVTTTTPEPSTRQQRAGVPVTNVGPATDATTGLGVPDREFMVGEAICQGDSGGPALSEQSGAVIGVVSRGGNGVEPDPNVPSSSCVNGFNWYSMTSGYKDLLTQGYAAAGQDPWWEGQPDPRLAKFGETCTASEACRSNLCLTGDKGAFTTCTQACDKATPCPSSYQCKVDTAGAGVCHPPDPVTSTTTTHCGCGLANVGAPVTMAWWLGAGALALGLRRRRRSQER